MSADTDPAFLAWVKSRGYQMVTALPLMYEAWRASKAGVDDGLSIPLEAPQ